MGVILRPRIVEGERLSGHRFLGPLQQKERGGASSGSPVVVQTWPRALGVHGVVGVIRPQQTNRIVLKEIHTSRV